MFDLSGKAAIVTGGSGALGRAVALGLAEYGADVLVAGLEPDILDEVKTEIQALGRRSAAACTDVTDEAEVDAMVARAVADLGRVDILVTAHGISKRIPAVDIAIEDWETVMDINVKGTLLCCRSAAREMIKQGSGGSMVTVGSLRGYHAHRDGYSGYGTSKAAVHHLTKQLAFEWARHQIRVNSIAPCIFWSPLTVPILSEKESYDRYAARIPLGRAAKPEDFVGAALFLASPASEMVTAHVLNVDGGTVAG